MNRRQYITFLGSLILAATCAASAIAIAQEKWPDKPVRLIVPFPPGGGTDMLSRMIGAQLGKENGKAFVVENHPGAGGNIGLDLVAKAAADGYTIGMGQATNLTINPSLYPEMPFDPSKDFVPIVLVAQQPMVLVVASTSPYKSVADLLKGARENKDGLKIGLAGNGTVGYLAGEMLARRANVKLLNIPYKGASPALVDLIGGQFDLYFGNTQSVMALVGSGKLRALAVTSAKRLKALPSVPTLAESGFPGFEAVTWSGLVGPAHMPVAVVAQINQQVNQILQRPDMLEKMTAEGSDALGGSPQDFALYLKSEQTKWSALIHDAGISLK
ncbi:MAG TPA: tripartite tricarboxylate transporter substrate binding protein [Herbaspirillum sp.]|nr:tripartite tricarboxylate transporter substrate binding protein [Herbaspirillum sp.]